MSIVLGFDVSSSTIGFGVIDYDGYGQYKLIDSGYFKPNKKVSLFKSLELVKADVYNLIKKHNPDDIAIEDVVQFMAKKSTARTIITLAVYNRTVGLTCYEIHGKEPSLWSVMAIRHKLKLNKQFPPKEDMPNIIEKHLNITFPWITKIVKKKGKAPEKKICVESYDVADGICVALYHAMKTNDAK